MKIRVDAVLKNHRGEPLKVSNETGAESATLASTVELALVQNRSPDHQTGAAKYRIYQLLQKLTGSGDEVDLPVEDIALLKELIGEFQGFGPVVVGAVYDALEGRG